MSPRSQCSALVLLLVSAMAPSLASAQASTGELRDEPTRNRVAGELGFFYTEFSSGELALFQPSFYGSFRLADLGGDGMGQGTFVDIDVAWRFFGLAGDASAFRAGNPYAGIRVGHRAQEWRARGGFGLTAPLTNAYDDYRGLMGGDFAGIFALAIGAPMQGVWDVWLASPLNMAVVLRGDFEYLGEYFAAGGEAALAAMLPVEYNGVTRDTALGAQLGLWGAGRPIPELAIGLRFQAVLLHSTAEGSTAEGFLALIPFVRGQIGAGFVEGRLVMNLDDPYGFAFDDGRVWAIYVLGGADF